MDCVPAILIARGEQHGLAGLGEVKGEGLADSRGGTGNEKYSLTHLFSRVVHVLLDDAGARIDHQLPGVIEAKDRPVTAHSAMTSAVLMKATGLPVACVPFMAAHPGFHRYSRDPSSNPCICASRVQAATNRRLRPPHRPPVR